MDSHDTASESQQVSTVEGSSVHCNSSDVELSTSLPIPSLPSAIVADNTCSSHKLAGMSCSSNSANQTVRDTSLVDYGTYNTIAIAFLCFENSG